MDDKSNGITSYELNEYGSTSLMLKKIVLKGTSNLIVSKGRLGIEMLYCNDLSYFMKHVVVTIHAIAFGSMLQNNFALK